MPFDAALLAEDVLGEDELYLEVARCLGLRFVTEVPALHPGMPWEHVNASGIAPVQTREAAPSFVLAPRGRALAALMVAGEELGPRVALTAPSRLRARLIRDFAGEIAERAACELGRRRPDLTARGGPVRWQRVALAGLGFVGVAATAWAPAAAVTLAAGLVSPLLALGIGVRLAACAAAEPAAAGGLPARPGLAPWQLPQVSVIVALHREARIVPQLVAALSAIDYPRAKLQVLFALEADDHETIAALSDCALPARFGLVLSPPGRPRTKPRALNVTLPFATGEQIVVYDAEDRPAPDQIRRAAERFAVLPREVACLQARLVIDNHRDGWLTRLFRLEYAALFDVVIPGLARLGLPIPLGGTSNHFRAEALRAVHAWDAWNVTEDADLGLRLARLGWRVDTLASDTLEEAPAGHRAWLAQRTRWLKGWMQTTLTHTRRPRELAADLGPLRAMLSVALMLTTVLGALLYPFGFALIALRLADGTLLTPASLAGAMISATALALPLGGAVALVWPIWRALAGRGWLHLAPWIALMPVYCLMMSVAAWRALHEQIRDPQRWNKTEHGLARTRDAPVRSRSPASP